MDDSDDDNARRMLLMMSALTSVAELMRTQIDQSGRRSGLADSIMVRSA